MNCKTCEYTLWNIAARQCPECGAPFKPSDFEFALNSVRFCCPHCRQPYYGTGELGHLVPRRFVCVGCRQEVDMDEMVLLPTAGVQESQTRVEEMPWIARGKIGRFKAWFKTVGKAMGDPARLMDLTPENHPATEAIAYSTLCNFIFFTTNLGIFFVAPSMIAALRLPRGAWSVAAVIAGAILVTAVLSCVLVCVWSVVTHGLLRITGPLASPLARTVHALGYSTGANALTAVPCFGIMMYPLFAVWWVISAGIMLHRVHRVSVWRAILAIGLPPLLIGAITLLGFFYIGITTTPRTMKFGTGGMVAPPPGGPAAAAPFAVEMNAVISLQSSVQDYRSDHDGKLPSHGTMLMTDGFTLASGYFGALSENQTLLDGIKVADVAGMSPEVLNKWANALDQSVRSGVVAHRVGDMVFTWHGVDPADPKAAALWLFVEAPAGPNSSSRVPVGLADGTVTVIPAETFAAELLKQNVIRASLGLVPLPDPHTVTMDRPARIEESPK